jgi:hypothetical protein
MMRIVGIFGCFGVGFFGLVIVGGSGVVVVFVWGLLFRVCCGGAESRGVVGFGFVGFLRCFSVCGVCYLRGVLGVELV